MKKACVIGTGSYLPEKVLTNKDLEKMVDTSDEWIITRTGIKERRIASSNEASSDLATQAAKRAIKDAGIKSEDIDAIIVATITPDMFFPSTGCIVQKNIKAKNAVAFDVNAACTGFIYALSIAKQFIESSAYRTVLVIATDTLSKIVDWQDRNTCVLFGDGAGAVVLSANESDNGILSLYLGSDGNYEDLLYIPGGGSRNPISLDIINNKQHYLKMAGGEVFKLAVGHMVQSAKLALKQASLDIKCLDLLIPHQANSRIIEAIRKRLKLSREKVFVNIEKYGNMSGATIAVALDEAAINLKRGDIVGLVSFGAGLTWGSGVIKWGK